MAMLDGKFLPPMTELAIRDLAREANARATAAQREVQELQHRMSELNERVRSCRAQYDGLRTLLREWHGKDFANTGTFPFIDDEQ